MLIKRVFVRHLTKRDEFFVTASRHSSKRLDAQSHIGNYSRFWLSISDLTEHHEIIREDYARGGLSCLFKRNSSWPPGNFSSIFTVFAGIRCTASADGVADVAEEPI